jgi:predicted DNA-binding transcriptional regulator YafY
VRDDWRTFRVDRIQKPITGAGRFTPRRPPEGGFAAYVSRSVAYAPWAYRARVILHCGSAAAAERFPPTVGVVEAIADNRCMLSTGAHSLDTLSFFLTLSGVEFEVAEPPELIARLQEMSRRLGRAIALSNKAL